MFTKHVETFSTFPLFYHTFSKILPAHVGGTSNVDIAIRVARPAWSAVAKHGCKQGQNLAKFTVEEFSLFSNNRPIV